MAEQPRQSYKIESIDRTEPPVGAEGSKWCRYVIKQGRNTIRGYRQGSVDTVKGEVKEIVRQLNDRRSGKRSLAAPKKRARN